MSSYNIKVTAFCINLKKWFISLVLTPCLVSKIPENICSTKHMLQWELLKEKHFWKVKEKGEKEDEDGQQAREKFV